MRAGALAQQAAHWVAPWSVFGFPWLVLSWKEIPQLWGHGPWFTDWAFPVWGDSLASGLVASDSGLTSFRLSAISVCHTALLPGPVGQLVERCAHS